jgi:3-oxoadipate enol-lactonase
MIDTRTIAVPSTARGRATQLHVASAGHGSHALLLHGYPLDHRMWLDLLHGELAQQRTLLAPDQRGHGRSPGSGDPVHTMELLADDAAAVIKSHADGPIDVVGLSMGGYVALALQALHPQLVRSLVLADTRAGADGDAARAARESSIAAVLAEGHPAIVAAMLSKLVLPTADAAVRGLVRTMIEGTPTATIVADLRGLKARPDRTSLLASIAVPTLVVVGEQDPITPPSEAKLLQQGIAGARLATIPEAAHMPPMEQPLAFAAAVGAFWRG